MNHFAFTKQENSNEPQKVEITLSEAVHDVIMELLKQEWLLPILNGDRKELGDGMTYYSFYLPYDDAERLKLAMLEAFSKLSGYNTSN